MSRSAATIFFLLSLALHVRAGDPRKINPPFDNKPNPFLQVLGLSATRVSLSRDSTRIDMENGGFVDMLLDRKRLWGFKQYDAEGRPMESGDLKAGTGRVHFVNGRHAYDATFEAGVLNGPMMRSDRWGSAWVPMLRPNFRNGLLQGEMRFQSLRYPQYLAGIAYFNNGMIWMSESYGRRNWLWSFLLFLVEPVKDTDKVCSRTLYVAGVQQSHSCLLMRKCRSCGF